MRRLHCAVRESGQRCPSQSLRESRGRLAAALPCSAPRAQQETPQTKKKKPPPFRFVASRLSRRLSERRPSSPAPAPAPVHKPRPAPSTLAIRHAIDVKLMRLRPQPCANSIANGITSAVLQTAATHRRLYPVVWQATVRPQSQLTAAPTLARQYYELSPNSPISAFSGPSGGISDTTTSMPETMPSNKNKRPAPSSAATPSASKKRKMENVQKYYSVQAGFVPGVYLTYAECQAQTAGFKGAVCEWPFLFLGKKESIYTDE